MFTQTEQRILEILSDGMPHHGTELLGRVLGEHGSLPTIQVHISNIRKKLLPIGQTILSECNPRNAAGTYAYRHVRLLKSMAKEGGSSSASME